MTNEERDLITQFIERIAAPPARPVSSVPYTLPAPAQPAIDREADALIADLMLRYPEARYRLTQTAFVQEHALAESQNTINRLQWELDQARTQQAPAPAAGSPWGAPAQSRGVIGNLFGGRQSPLPNYAQQQPQSAPPPPPVHAPGYQPGMFQQGGGSSFLGSALTTAAGVAGGMIVGNMLMNAFSGHGNTAQAATGGTPWTNATSAPPDSGWQEASPVSHQDPGQEDSGWTDAGSDEEF